MYVDHFKEYQAFFGKVVERMVNDEKQWKQAEILNKLDCALQTRDRAWYDELMEQWKGWK
ncbi:hypothetical protein V7111_07340 [Neobacillus niacini]|uniref:hypothetical protein n=1 Tax=Neobacillus niacini TaxID=86668 RepID=UPI002FFECC21